MKSSTQNNAHYLLHNVTEPSTEIIGAPDLYIESGSTINLTCVILYSPEPPAYIFWNHNDGVCITDDESIDKPTTAATTAATAAAINTVSIHFMPSHFTSRR